ncbi:MAG: Uma2 family endonuclease [Gemmatimonadaceae bacterium]
MPALQSRKWTADEVRRLIDEHPEPTPRMECVDGALLVTPSPGPRHQRIILAVVKQIDAFVASSRIGEVRLSPSDVRLKADLVQPDLYFLAAPHRPAPAPLIPALAIEVLSPGSAKFDRVIKRRSYLRNGVAEYWIVDGESETVERWRPGVDAPDVLDDLIVWNTPAGEFTLDIRALFAAVREIETLMD